MLKDTKRSFSVSSISSRRMHPQSSLNLFSSSFFFFFSFFFLLFLFFFCFFFFFFFLCLLSLTPPPPSFQGIRRLPWTRGYILRVFLPCNTNIIPASAITILSTSCEVHQPIRSRDLLQARTERSSLPLWSKWS